MLRGVLLIIALALPYFAEASSKIYKWTDENGKVHYSSKPPANSNSNDANIEVSNIKKEKVLPVIRRDNSYYCGERQIFWVNRKGSLAAEINKRGEKEYERYERDLRNAEKQFARNGKNVHNRYTNYENHTYSQKRLKDDIAEYRCAVEWFSEQIDYAKSNKSGKIAKLKEKIGKINEAIMNRCGQEPPEGYLQEEQKIHRKWKSCKRNNSGALSELESELEMLTKY